MLFILPAVFLIVGLGLGSNNWAIDPLPASQTQQRVTQQRVTNILGDSQTEDSRRCGAIIPANFAESTRDDCFSLGAGNGRRASSRKHLPSFDRR
jgi:hypothetical protein